MALAVNDPVVTEKRALLGHILQACLGLKFETTISSSEFVPGEEMKLHHTATLRANFPVRWVAVRYPGIQREISKQY